MRAPASLPILAATALLLAACQAAPAPVPPVAAVEAAGTASIVLTTALRSASTRQLLANVPVWQQSDINHLDITLYTVAGAVETPVGATNSTITIPGASIGSQITFSNLKDNRTYRARAEAYSTAGTGSPISVPNASYVDIQVVIDPTAPVISGPLVVDLIDKPFAAGGSVAISVPDGDYDYTGAADVAGSSDVAYTFVEQFLGTEGTFGYTAVSTGTSARLNAPSDVVVAPDGDLYVADMNNHVIRRVTPAGGLSTFAGATTAAHQDANGSSARFDTPRGLAVDAAGNLYVAENRTIRKIEPDADVTTLAGDPTQVLPYADGTGTAAKFVAPDGIAVLPNGDLVVSEPTSHRIRRVTQAGVVTTLAGQATPGTADGVGGAASFNGPSGVAADRFGNVYVADTNSGRIRKVDATTGRVTTVATGLAGPRGLAFESTGQLLITEANAVKRLSPFGVVTLIAGQTGTSGSTHSVVPLSARFTNLAGLAAGPDGKVYLADAGWHVIRGLRD